MSALDTVVARPVGPRLSSITPLGIALIALWAIAALGVIYAIGERLDPEFIAKYGSRVLSGLVTTLKLVSFSFVIGTLLSVPVAAGRLSRNPIASGLAYAYSYFFRGTPLLAQIFLIYYGAGQFSADLKALGLWNFFKDAFDCALLSFSLNTAAYQGEILSGALRNVPTGQREAAAALGLHRFVALYRIVLPQALISAIRPYGNEVILLAKASAIASIVTVLDLMGQTRFVYSRTYDIAVYIWAAVIYLVLVVIVARLVRLLEAYLTRHLRTRRVLR